MTCALDTLVRTRMSCGLDSNLIARLRPAGEPSCQDNERGTDHAMRALGGSAVADPASAGQRTTGGRGGPSGVPSAPSG